MAAFVTLLIFNNQDLFPQQVVDGSKAVYTRINRVSCYATNDPDTVFVVSTASFAIRDTVLIYQSIGASAYPPGNEEGKGTVENMYNTGKYAIFKISEIVDDTTVVLNTTLPAMMAYNPGEVGQLIRIPTYDRATLEAGFDFPAWDPVTQTGGIFPVIVRKKLTLNTNMSAVGKGFRGALPAGQYTGDCADSDPAYLKDYYTATAQDTAGGKGESLVERGYGYSRGKDTWVLAGEGETANIQAAAAAETGGLAGPVVMNRHHARFRERSVEKRVCP